MQRLLPMFLAATFTAINWNAISIPTSPAHYRDLSLKYLLLETLIAASNPFNWRLASNASHLSVSWHGGSGNGINRPCAWRRHVKLAPRNDVFERQTAVCRCQGSALIFMAQLLYYKAKNYRLIKLKVETIAFLYLLIMGEM